MRRANVLIVILLALLVLAACGKDTPLSSTTATPTAPSEATTTVAPRTARDGCEAVAPAQPLEDAQRRPPRQRLDRKGTYTAVIATNCGTIRIQLAALRSPKTTSSFAALVRSRFYDGLSFHRIAKPGGNDYVIQGGDPLGTGNGDPGYRVVERPVKKTRYVRGVVAMAKAPTEKPGTSGSQFFIVTAAETPLEPDYALLGRVVGGKSIVRRIAAVPTDPSTEMPIDPVVISSVRIRSSRR